jgi:3-dehydroquinate synthase
LAPEYVTLKTNLYLLEKIVINTATVKSEILIGERWTNLIKYVPDGNVVIITDDNIQKLYGSEFPGLPVLAVTPGEKSKNLEVINDLAGKLLNLGIDRNGFIIGIGGGVVCDLAGFLASVYMRGIRFGFVSTSLLSQVDASVGGKNGVNVGPVKNIIGNFRQPEFVICDPAMLKTLPDDEYLSGLAELIKMGVICDADLFETLEHNADAVLSRDYDLLADLIKRSVNLKAKVVTEDEKEIGIRKILNFGHTFGHAIEALTGLKHGYAIAAGMIISADISVELEILSQIERDRLKKLLETFKLLINYNVNSDHIKALILQDKKKYGGTMDFVFLEQTGKALVKRIPVEKLFDYYKILKSRQ